MLNYQAPTTRLGCAAPKLELFDRQENHITFASGTFFRRNNRFFLISNWHVFSGQNYQTKSSLGLREPYFIDVHYRTLVDGVVSITRKVRIAVRDMESSLGLWNEHPAGGSDFDIAGLEIGNLLEGQIVCANDDFIQRDEKTGKLYDPVIVEGQEVFILGYPKGIGGAENYPIWKRASLATPLFGKLDGQQKFVVDSATSDGLSGAPVIFSGVNYITPAPHRSDGQHEVVLGKSAKVFLGIYSGRIKKLADQQKADLATLQLGYVWHRDLVEELVSSVELV